VVASTEAAMEEGKEVMGSMASADEVEVVPEILAGEVAAEWAEEEDGAMVGEVSIIRLDPDLSATYASDR